MEVSKTSISENMLCSMVIVKILQFVDWVG